MITQGGTADVLKAEASLQIDSLTQCADVPEDELQPHFHHRLMEGSVYSNLINPECDTSHLGVPYAVNTMEQLSPPGSPAEGGLRVLALQRLLPGEGLPLGTLVNTAPWATDADSSIHSRAPWELVNKMFLRADQHGCHWGNTVISVYEVTRAG